MSRALKATTSTPNTLLSSRDHYAALVMGFPELEFSPSEVLVWPRAEPLQSRGEQRSAYSAVSALHKKYEDPSKNMVMLRESCQVVRPVSYSELPEASKKQLQGPSNITAYLEVVDLMDQKLRLVHISRKQLFYQVSHQRFLYGFIAAKWGFYHFGFSGLQSCI